MSNYIFERLIVKINGIEKFYNVPKLGECPHCNKSIAPYVISISEADLETRTFAIMAQCPFCSKYFTMAYNLPFGTKIPEPIIYKYSNKKIALKLPKELEKISERFIKIYTQSLIAEEEELDEIVGLGLKQSIEFLIRDYLINFKKEDRNEILENSLGEVVKKISDFKIVNLALSYKWLNHSNFCSIKFEKKDIQEMKKFINIICEYIAYNVLIKAE